MVTAIGFAVWTFSAGVTVLALLGLIVGLFWRRLFTPSARLAVIFGIFAMASAYVWLEAGPDVDYRVQANEHPRIYNPPIQRIDI